MNLRDYVRDIPDFPETGVIFKDVTPMLKNPESFKECLTILNEKVDDLDFDVVLAPEARGFIFAAPIALHFGKGFVPVRKPGKLPYKKHSIEYTLEYGKAKLEMHTDAVLEGEKVLIVDDVLATGGTMEAICKMVEKAGGEVSAILSLIELTFLEPKKKLRDYEVRTIIEY
ncbi:MAG: adenine phosphoribosyltransferase [Kosmotogaceae bacterium]|jgi:adenine phosphoribosyltransferase